MSRAVTRSIRITYKAADEEYYNLQTEFDVIHRFLGGGKEADTHYAIYQAGIIALLNKVSNTGQEAQKRAAIKERVQQIYDAEQNWHYIETIYEKSTSDEFNQWCQQNQINVAAFLEWREAKQRDSIGDEYRHWLADKLKEGEPIATANIRQMAMEEGVIKTSQDWNYMRLTAHRCGYVSKRHGCWQNGVYNSPNNAESPF